MIVLFDSVHGTTRKVAGELSTLLHCQAIHVTDNFDDNTLIILCPTYGDEELPPEMEKWITNAQVAEKRFAICELGNYYGYDDYTFGAAKIIRHQLLSLGWKEFFRPLSLDSLPSIEWDDLHQWAGEINAIFERNNI